MCLRVLRSFRLELSRDFLAGFAEGSDDLVAALAREADFGQIHTDAGDNFVSSPDSHGQTDRVFGRIASGKLAAVDCRQRTVKILWRSDSVPHVLIGQSDLLDECGLPLAREIGEEKPTGCRLVNVADLATAHLKVAVAGGTLGRDALYCRTWKTSRP